MPTRNVVLTPRHENLIKALVESGRYQNASEVLREGLRLVEAQEEQAAARLRALREAAWIGFADLEEGRYRDFDSVDDLADYLHTCPIRRRPEGATDASTIEVVRMLHDSMDFPRHLPGGRDDI